MDILLEIQKKEWYKEFPFCSSVFENIVFSYLYSIPEGEERFNALKDMFPHSVYFQNLSFQEYISCGGLFGK